MMYYINISNCPNQSLRFLPIVLDLIIIYLHGGNVPQFFKHSKLWESNVPPWLKYKL